MAQISLGGKVRFETVVEQGLMNVQWRGGNFLANAPTTSFSKRTCSTSQPVQIVTTNTQKYVYFVTDHTKAHISPLGSMVYWT